MKTVKVRLAKIPMELLERIHETGLWGLTLEETAERLLLEQIRKFIREEDLLLELPKAGKPGRTK